MTYLLDSDIVISFLSGDPDTVAYVRKAASGGLAISVVTYMEVVQGALANDDPSDAEQALEVFLESAQINPFSESIARRCAELRFDLARSGMRVRPRTLDLMVAATALYRGMRLVTRNVADYADIPGLTLSQIG
jgi:predicted nucleic acid-binding protein